MVPVPPIRTDFGNASEKRSHPGCSPTAIRQLWAGVPSLREKYRRLATSRTLQPIDDTPVWSITCLYVARNHRRQGLTRELIEAACAFAAGFGASVVEAYARISPEKESSPLALYTGTEGSLARAGFRVVARPTPIRRIMRKRLS
jgi:GNAT superfamily N-acetyltransferase